MDAQTVRMRLWVDEPVDQSAPGRYQLDVLAATGIDAERLATEYRRDLVRVQARRVDDGPRQDRLGACAELDAIGTRLGAYQRRPGQQRGVAFGAEPRQRADEGLGLEDAGVGREQRVFRRDVRLSRADERLVYQAQAFDAVPFTAHANRFERFDLVAVVRDDQLSATRVRHVVGREIGRASCRERV